MMFFRPLLIACIAASAAQAEMLAVALPEGFDGDYAPQGVACEGLAVIHVSGGVMVGGEFAITVTDLVEDPNDPRRVEATLLNQGGGGEWVDSAALTLSADGRSLRFDYPESGVVIWERCDNG